MKLLKLKSVSNVITGFPFKGNEYTDRGVRTVRGENVTEGRLRWDSTKHWNQPFDKFEEYSLKADDIVVGMDGSKVGKNKARIFEKDLPLLLAQRVACIRAKKGTDQVFLYYCINNNRFEDYVYRIQTGSAVPHISKTQIEEYSIPAFDLDTQKKLSKTLSDLDRKIEINNKINTKLEAMAKLIYEYWFVQFDFPDAKGKPYKSSGGKMVYNEALKYEIPEGWEAKELASILKCNYSSIGKNGSFDVIEYLDTGSLTKNVVKGTERIYPLEDKVPSRAKRIVGKDDILYSTVRPNLCHYGIIKKPLHNMVASTGFAQLASRIGWISNDLIYTFLTSPWVTSKLHQIATLSVSAYPSISPNNILELNIALPKDKKFFEPINLMFATIYSKISLNQQENIELSALRDWLLPMLMNGQVTVKGTHHSKKGKLKHGSAIL
ncbi:MAG: restriction endonuclease subunit S [Candidatus Berkiella sp.]